METERRGMNGARVGLSSLKDAQESVLDDNPATSINGSINPPPPPSQIAKSNLARSNIVNSYISIRQMICVSKKKLLKFK